MPNVHEIVYDVGYTVSINYGPDGETRNAVLYIASYAKHVNLGFFHGATLPDPKHVFEGTGARMRHVKFNSVEQVDVPWLPEYLDASLSHAGLRRDMGDGVTDVRPRGASKRR